jgi:hypothetical protein
MKQCKYCDFEQPLSNFNFSNKAKNYYKPYCKQCEAEINHKRYLQTKEDTIKSTKAWQTANRDKYINYQKNYNERRKKQ